MITMLELLSGNSINDVPIAAQRNLEDLLPRLNKLRLAWNKPLIITSGFRSIQHHIDVYRTKALREGKPFSNLQIPMGSKHLFGQAADFSDPTGELYKWAKANEAMLIDAGLWCEEGTVGWLHCQSVPPRSGRRWFLP